MPGKKVESDINDITENKKIKEATNELKETKKKTATKKTSTTKKTTGTKKATTAKKRDKMDKYNIKLWRKNNKRNMIIEKKRIN